jgi:hypothetical protein
MQAAAQNCGAVRVDARNAGPAYTPAAWAVGLPKVGE